MFPKGTRVIVSGKWRGVVDNIAKTSHGYVYAITLDDGNTCEAHESVVAEGGRKMKVGDKVRVREHVKPHSGNEGTLVEAHANEGGWVVRFGNEDDRDADLMLFYESELELIADEAKDEGATKEVDLTGKRVRITRGYFLDKVGTVVGKNFVGEWLVDLRYENPLSFPTDKLEVLPDISSPTLPAGVNGDTWEAKIAEGMQQKMQQKIESEVMRMFGVATPTTKSPTLKTGERVKVWLSSRWVCGTITTSRTDKSGTMYEVKFDSGKQSWHYADKVKRLLDEPLELPEKEVLAAADGDIAPAKDPVVFTCDMWLAILRD